MTGTAPQDRTAAALARTARHVTDRDRWLLAMLHEHGVLTTNQLVRLRYAASPRAVQIRLADLHRWGVLARFQPMAPTHRGSAPIHHVVDGLGARILAAEIGADLSAIGWRPGRALAAAHRLSLRHDTAMTDLVCDLVTDPGMRVVTWWSATRCRRLLGHHVRPDALIALIPTPPSPAFGPAGAAGSRPGTVQAVWEMACEYDTGSTTLGTLAAKVRGYHDAAAATGTTIAVGVWIARPGREPGARRALAAALRALPDPSRVRVLTGTTPPTIPDATGTAPSSGPVGSGAVGSGAVGSGAVGSGADGRVWLPLWHHVGRPGRVRLADLAFISDRPTLAQILYQPDDRHEIAEAGPGRARDGHRIELPAPSPYPPRVTLPPPARAHPGGTST